MFTKKTILHFCMLFGAVNIFDWWYVSQKKSTKRVTQKKFKRIKKIKTHIRPKDTSVQTVFCVEFTAMMRQNITLRIYEIYTRSLSV